MGCRTPPAAAMASSKRSPLGVSGRRMLVATSPTTVALDVALRSTRTNTCGWFALRARRASMVFSICCGVKPTTLMAPAKGTLTTPLSFTICSGKVVCRVEVKPARASTTLAPNSAAGGASQTAISSASPAPTVYFGGFFVAKDSAKKSFFCAAANWRTTVLSILTNNIGLSILS